MSTISRIFAMVIALASAASAQWLNYPTPGIPRTPDGKPNLAAPAPHTSDGKPDLSGVWSGPGPGSYDRNIARDLQPSDIQPWAEALYQQRVRDLGKDARARIVCPILSRTTTSSTSRESYKRRD